MAIKINIYNQKAEVAGEMELDGKVFGVPANKNLVHQAVVTQMANRRQVLAHTKDRSEVRGGGKKPWRQKGTGRARSGSSRSPIWKGGGVTFGPNRDRNFSKKINKKMRQKAIIMALSDKVASGNFLVMEKLDIDSYKTKIFNKIIEGMEKVLNKNLKPEAGAKKTGEKAEKLSKKFKRSVLIINDKKDEKVKYSGRNLAGAEIINLENINILDLLKYRDLILTVDGVKKLEERYK
ncbi:MAG: 50S ribosomal protein L4 [Patescibacteria group bacterium]|nr:50S ribosomal protein L4 [Patescibacteria group bacterium]MDD5295260.1 50S ribosomal protein L4 [Patescibacteria group bacterium]MDD5554904.1 50S ribosomal protein L4 [Patescibacteria group bacterium]